MGKKAVRDEDLTEFSVWIHKDSAREADTPEPDDEPDPGVEEIRFFLRPLSGYELERAGNKTSFVKGKGRGDGKETTKDGTSSLEHIAKCLVRMDPPPVDHNGNNVENYNTDVIRGFPAWLIMRITEHMDLTKRSQEDDEKK
jgi:hypothetical protein